MSKGLFALAFLSFALLAPTAHARVDVEIGIGIPFPGTVYVPPPPVIAAPPTAPVIVGTGICPLNAGYYTAECVDAQLREELFADAELRERYREALSGCSVWMGGFAYYRPGCVDGIRIGEVPFWERVHHYHKHYRELYGREYVYPRERELRHEWKEERRIDRCFSDPLCGGGFEHHHHHMYRPYGALEDGLKGLASVNGSEANTAPREETDRVINASFVDPSAPDAGAAASNASATSSGDAI